MSESRQFIYRSQKQSCTGSKIMMLIKHISVRSVEAHPDQILVSKCHISTISPATVRNHLIIILRTCAQTDNCKTSSNCHHSKEVHSKSFCPRPNNQKPCRNMNNQKSHDILRFPITSRIYGTKQFHKSVPQFANTQVFGVI